MYYTLIFNDLCGHQSARLYGTPRLLLDSRRHVGPDPNQVAISRLEVGIKRPRGFSAAMGIAQGFVPIGATSRFARCTAHHSHWHNKCIAGASAHPSTTVALQSSNWMAKCPRKTKHPSKAAASCRQSSTVQMPALSDSIIPKAQVVLILPQPASYSGDLQQASAAVSKIPSIPCPRWPQRPWSKWWWPGHPAPAAEMLRTGASPASNSTSNETKQLGHRNRYMKYLPVWADANKCMHFFMMRPIRDIRGLKKDLNSAGREGSTTPIIWALQPRQHHLYHPHQKRYCTWEA